MKKKIFKWTFGGWVSLMLASLAASLGMMTTNVRPKTSNLVPQENQTLIPKQKNFVNKTRASQEMPDLEVSSDGTVKGFSNPEEVKSTYADGAITLAIPAQYKGITVRKIAPGAFAADRLSSDPTITDKGGSKIGKVILANTISEIGKGAFFACFYLKEAILSNNITSIGKFAFQLCGQLQRVNIPKSITRIEQFTFCSVALNNLFIPSKVNYIGENAIENLLTHLSLLTIISMSNQLSLDKNALIDPLHQDPSERLAAWVANDNVKNTLINFQDSDQKKVFKNGAVNLLNQSGDVYTRNTNQVAMAGLTEQGRTNEKITVPSTVNEVPDFVFSECSEQLKKITFKSSTIKFSDYSLFGVPKDVDYYVVSLDVEKALRNLGIAPEHIVYCGTKFNVDLSGTVRKVNQTAIIDGVLKFDQTADSSIVIKSIGPHVCSQCTDVEEVIFSPNSQITKIDRAAFDDSSVTKAKYYVSENCHDLIGQLVLVLGHDSDRVTIQGTNFDVSLKGVINKVHSENTSINIPDNYGGITIKSIGANAFENAKQIKKINFSSRFAVDDSLPIDQQAFSGLNLKDTYCYIDKQNPHINELAKQLNNAKIDDDHLVFSGKEFDITKSGLIHRVKEAQSVTSVTIPTKTIDGQAIKGLGANAFSESTQITKVAFSQENSEFEIDPNAFSNLINAYYFVNQQNTNLITQLSSKAQIDDHYLVLIGQEFDITKSGLIVNVHQVGQNKSIHIKSIINNIKVSGIGSNAFSESSQINEIIFDQDSSQTLTINEHAFSYLDVNNTYYYVNQQNLPLISQLENANIDDNHLVFAGSEFDLTKGGRIHRVKENEQTTSVTIPIKNIGSQSITGIDSHAFVKCPKIKSVTFSQENPAFKIDPDAFSDLNQNETYYHINESASNIVVGLKDQVGDNDHIVISGDNFCITVAGTLLSLNSSNANLVVDNTYADINVTGFGANSLVDENAKSVELTNGIKLTGKVDENAFSNLNTDTILYIYGSDNVTVLANATKNFEVDVNNDGGDFFVDFNNSNRLNGLTFRGRMQQELTIPDTIGWIGAHTFDNCSPLLNKITLKSSNLTVQQGAFQTDAFKSISDKVNFFVYSKAIEKLLIADGIKENNIHLASPSPSQKSGLSTTAMGIIVGSILVALLLLALGISLPMRKQHKLSTLQAKWNGKIINRLSSANAMAFKKMIEATGAIKKEVNALSTNVKALNAGSPRKPPAQGVVKALPPQSSTNPPKPVLPNSLIHSTNTIFPKSPTESKY